jgi:hypothetical protein
MMLWKMVQKYIKSTLRNLLTHQRVSGIPVMTSAAGSADKPTDLTHTLESSSKEFEQALQPIFDSSLGFLGCSLSNDDTNLLLNLITSTWMNDSCFVDLETLLSAHKKEDKYLVPLFDVESGNNSTSLEGNFETLDTKGIAKELKRHIQKSDKYGFLNSTNPLKGSEDLLNSFMKEHSQIIPLQRGYKSAMARLLKLTGEVASELKDVYVKQVTVIPDLLVEKSYGSLDSKKYASKLVLAVLGQDFNQRVEAVQKQILNQYISATKEQGGARITRTVNF